MRDESLSVSGCFDGDLPGQTVRQTNTLAWKATQKDKL